MPISNVFGRMLSAAQLEKAAIAVLQEWFPDYIAEQEAQEEWPPGTLPLPVNYDNRNSFDAQAGEPTPKVIVISPGLNDRPVMTGGMVYRAIWRLGVGVAMNAPDEPTANDWSKAYGSIVRKIILDKQSLGGFPGIAEITWVDETYEDLPIGNQIQLYKAAGIYFLVDVENVVTALHGPSTHGQDPYGYADEVDIELVKVPTDQQMGSS